MNKTDFDLKIPYESRSIRVRFALPKHATTKLPQLVIIATGYSSNMDRYNQLKLAKYFQNAGFATLQFNFMGHGTEKNKSDGNMQDATLTSSIKDLKSVWNYAKRHLSDKVDTKHIAIAANSYGALVSLRALEKNIIAPESMTLISPMVLDKYKPWFWILKYFVMLMPNLASKIFKAPKDFCLDISRHHTKVISKKNLLGNTAVYFLVGEKDKIAPYKYILKWCKMFNQYQPSNVPFVDNVQARCKIYANVPHFNIPENMLTDMHKRSIEFIKKTRILLHKNKKS